MQAQTSKLARWAKTVSRRDDLRLGAAGPGVSEAVPSSFRVSGACTPQVPWLGRVAMVGLREATNPHVRVGDEPSGVLGGQRELHRTAYDRGMLDLRLQLIKMRTECVLQLRVARRARTA